MKKPLLRNLLRKKEIYHLLLALLTFGFLCLHGAQEVYAQQGLVAAYGFNENSGVLVTDSSGNGNTGTISGATWSTSGKFSSALSFNGTSSSVTINDSSSLDLTTGMTLEAWVYPTASGGWRTVMLKETSNGMAFGLYASDDTSKAAAFINVGGFDRSAIATNSLSLNTWTHLAATYDGASLRLYVNGTQVGSQSITGSMAVSSVPVRIGGNAVWGEYFSGRIDEVRIYNTALSSAQIQIDMNSAINPPVPDTTPPTVTSASPPSEATAVSTATTVTATFSEAMSTTTITSSTFLLAKSSGGSVSATVAYDSATMKAVLTPSSALAASTSYTATVTTGVKDVAGNAPPANYSWSFTTSASDTTPPTVASVSPLNGAIGVSIGTPVTAVFSEAMNSATIISITFELRNPANNVVAGTVTYNSATNTATLSPSSSLSISTTYTAIVTTGAKDLAGNALAANYTWSFTTASSDTTRPSITSVNPSAGATGVSTGTQVTVIFSEAMKSSTLTTSTFYLKNSSNAAVSASVSYNSATNTATLTPSSSLANSATYTATVTTGVTDIAGNSMATAYNWSFTTVNSGPLGDGPGGPILVISSGSNPFSRYFGEVLLAEGFNQFSIQDISAVSSAILANYDLVILGEISLTSSQVTMLTNWVNAGGNLIAMRPDKQLAGLLGLSNGGSTLSEAYLLVNTASGPGTGIVGQTIQFHGTADRYTLSGASNLASLYSNATTSTSNPAVTLRSVGPSGGQAAAFTFDLAKSIVYTRQGNPAWAGQERDGYSPIRSDDLFYGPASSDPQTNWVNLDKVSIPQADEQQRLLANMMIKMNADKKPLPRFWYFPDMFEAVVVMTGDDHGMDGTAGRFDKYVSSSPVNCSVEDWECIRSTSYVFPDPVGAMTNSQAFSYSNVGFEVGLHVSTGCADFTRASLDTFFTSQLSAWKNMYPSLPSPKTHRVHCIAWSDYTSMAEVELSKGVRLDVNYYYWPPTWIADRPGFFTGSGIPMRFAKSDGSLIDVYQAATQMTDESGQSYPFTVKFLLDKAIGTEGFYGAFVANMHTDASLSSGSDSIIQSAKDRGAPVISARQLLTWLDARNSSSIRNLAWNGRVLTFAIDANASARRLQAMVPILDGCSVSYVRYNGSSIGYSLRVVKGIQYAIFDAKTGSYTIGLAGDTTEPSITSVLPAPGATEVSVDSQIAVTFSEAMDPATITSSTLQLRNPSNAIVTATVSYSTATNTATLVPSSPLATSTMYTATVVEGSGGVSDAAGNPLASSYTWSFTTGDLGSQESYSIWIDSMVPGVLSANDTSALELGVKFKSSVDGYITGVRFYKGAANTGTHIGNLWTESGTLLGSVTFTNETASGWQVQSLAAPVVISAGTTYVISYHTNAGGYSYNGGYFASSGFDNAPLRALSNTESGGNGVYRYGTSSGFPTQTWNSTNYWVDVIFQGSVGTDTTPPTVTSVLPSSGGVNVSTDSTVSATFSEAMDAATIGTNTFTLVDPSNASVPAAVTYNSVTKTATLDPTGLLSSATTYTATVVGGSNGLKDVAGNPLAANHVWSFTTASGGTPTSYSIWDDTAVPSVVAANDSGAVELGVKFQSTVPGNITGILFYKGSGNTGTHIGNLWASTGTRLATVTFTSETASGWQYQALATPVAISANTTYIVSYFAPVGRYSADGGYFATSGVDSSPLKALSNSESGGNGVYRYGSSSDFPNQTWNSTNYWVDIEFKQ